MNLDQIKLRLHGGFRAFALHLSDGRKFNIPHPEFILLGRQTMGVLDEDREVAFLDPLHVVAIKNLPLQKNGRRTRPRGSFGLLIFRTGLSESHCHSLMAMVNAWERAAR